MNNNQFNKSMQTIKNYVDENIPTKTSQLQNDSGYLTEHQDLSNYQTKADDTLTTNSKIVTGAINELNANCVKLGTDLDDTMLDIDKNILTRISSLESELDNKLESNDLSNYYNKPEVDQMIADVIIGGKVDLSGYAKTSDIPTKTSELTNDSGFITTIPSEYITETELNTKGYLTEHQSLENYALKTDIPTVPTKTSQLTNDSSYATESYVSNKIAEAKLEQSDVDLSGYQTKEDNMLETTNKTIVGAINEVNTNVMLKANKSDIPTKTSELTNDSKFLTSIPSEYITESELTAKNYATTSQIPTSLPANGGNANTVGGFSVWVGTQTEYDAIATKSSTTIYLIKE